MSYNSVCTLNIQMGRNYRVKGTEWEIVGAQNNNSLHFRLCFIEPIESEIYYLD